MAFIESHLPRLLLDHDCLVIPGLGGFVCNDRPARFDESAQELVPPRRAIQFNERLLHNDGVLAHAVAVAEALPYPEALAAVEDEAASMRARLQVQRSVVLPQVGRLFVAASGATQFMADAELERLLDGFGLQRIPLKPVVRETDVPVVLPIGTSVRWPRIAAAIAVPLLAGGLWWFSGNPEVAELSFWPELGNRSVVASYAPSPAPDAPAALNWVADFETAAAGDAPFRFDFNEGVTSADGLRIGAPPVEVVPAVLSFESAAFALVAGAFSKSGNAKGHAASLAAEGLQPEVHPMGALHFVTVGLFTAEEDARVALAAVRQAGHEAVWMKRL